MKHQKHFIVLTCIGRFAESETVHSYGRQMTPLLKEQVCSEYGFNDATSNFSD